MGAIGSVQAATSTWSGATSTNWNTGSNWSGGIPGSTGTALFASTVAHSAVVINAASLQVGEIVFSGTVNESLTGTLANALKINGSALGVDIDNQTTSFNAQIGAAISMGSGGTQIFQATGTSSALTFTNTVDLTGTPIVKFNAKNAANVITFSGAIVDSGSTAGVTMSGSGTVIYSGANTYAGVTTIASGTLQIGNNGATGSLGTNANVVDNAALVYDLTSSPTVSTNIIGTGSLTQKGSGNLILTGANTYSGITSIAAGSLQIGNGGTTGSIGTGAVTDNASLIVDRTNTYTMANAIGGSGALVQDGLGGTLILTGTNTYSGVTTVASGSTLQVGNGGSTGSLGTGIVTDAGALVFDLTGTQTTAANLTGAGTVTVTQNSGTMVLTGANTYTGATSIGSGATLQIGNGTTNSALTTTSGITDNGALVFDVTNATSYANTISGTGALVQEGSGTLILAHANTYTGDTSITGGMLTVGAANAIGSSSDVIVNGATLNLNSLNDAIGSLAGNATGTVSLGSGVLTISDNANTTFAGTISGTNGVLVMNGNGTSGTLVLTGTNSYTGATTIGANATLQIGNGGTAGAIGNGAITDNGTLVVAQSDTYTAANSIGGTGSLVQNGNGTTGTLILTGSNTYTGATTIGANATLQIGNGGTAGTLGTGSVADNGALVFAESNTYTAGNSISGTGSLVQNGNGTTGTLILTGGNTYTGATTIGANATLQIGNGGTAGTLGTGSVTDGGRLVFNQTDTYTAANTISGGGALVQAGTGTLILTGTDTYSGPTTITSGLLQIGNGGAAGSAASSSAFVDNSALAIDVTNATTISGAISGSGSLTVMSTGTAVLSNNNYSYSGATTVNSGATLQVGILGSANGSLGTGSVTDNGTIAFDQTGSSTASGAISGAGGLVQAGTGTTFLTNTNTYSGATDVNAGTLEVTNANALNSTNQVSVNSGATLALSGGVKMTAYGNNLGVLQLNNNAVAGTPATLSSIGGINSWESDINLKQVSTISETAGGLLYVGGGYVGGSQTFSNLSLNGFTLTLAANVGSPSNVPNYEFNPSGTSPGDAGYTYAAANIFLNAPSITGTGGLTVTGPGTVSILGEVANTFTGTTTVTSGKLIVDGTVASIISSNTVVVGASGGGSAATLQMGQTSEVGTAQSTGPLALSNLVGTLTAGTPNTTMVIYSNGTFDMNNGSEILANLTMQGGLINEGSYGNNTLLTVFGGISSLSNSTEAVITNGAVGLAAANFTFNIAKGVASGPDMEIDGQLQDANGFTATGTQVGVIKTGAGTLMLQNDNSAAHGVFDIQQGVLAIQANKALGADTSTKLGTDNQTIVETGAQLQIQQNPGAGGTNLDITNKTLTLNGTGGGTGALLNASGSNTWAGYIYLNSASTIGASASSSLLIGDPSGVSSNIIDANSSSTALTTTGSGLITIDGGLSAQIGSVIKTGTGTTILAGIDSYTGATSITAGALRITNNASLAGPSGGVNVANNATLQLANNINETGINTTINGSGNASGNGAIENVSGTNSYGGNITLASASQVNVDVSGDKMTLLGNVTNGGNLLTVAGAGNTTITGNVTGTGGLTMTGTGTLTLNNSIGSHNTYSGVTSVASGTLSFGSAASPSSNQIGASNQLAIASGATVNVNNSTQSLGTFTGNGTLNFGTSNTTSVVQINGSDTFNGIFTGTGKIYIPSGASLTLGPNGANVITVGGIAYTYYDPTLNIELAGGTLNVVSGTNDSFGTLTIDASTIPADGPSVLNFTSSVGNPQTSIDFTGNSGTTGGVVIAAGAQLNVTGWANTVDYFYSTNQPGVRFQMPLNQIVFDPPTWQGSNTTWLVNPDGPDTDHQITPVPEPSFYGAIVVGLALGLAGFRTYRRRLVAERVSVS